MIQFDFKLNKKNIRFTVDNYGGILSVGCSFGFGILMSGYIKDNIFYLQSTAREIAFFEDDLIKSVIKAYNKVNKVKIKSATY